MTIDPLNTALYGAFMMEGVRDHCQNIAGVTGYNQLLARWNNGCLELIQELVSYAPYIEQKVLERLDKGDDVSWPGIFEYEVVAVFGMWFTKYVMEHGYTPPTVEGKAELDSLIQDFFNQ